MLDLWKSESVDEWRDSLDRYEAVIEAQGVDSLPDLDRWYRIDLPAAIERRNPAHITHDEIVLLTRWKMTRGVWRARNLALVRSNPPEEVVAASIVALSRVPDPKGPIKELTRLNGVGPATASAMAAAAAPQVYPFFDDLVSDQVPELGPVAYTLGYYASYAQALRDRAASIGLGWTPVLVERALWANAGGKARVRG